VQDGHRRRAISLGRRAAQSQQAVSWVSGMIVERYGGQEHLDVSIVCAVSMQHRLSRIPEEILKSNVVVRQFYLCKSGIASRSWKCRTAREEDA